MSELCPTYAPFFGAMVSVLFNDRRKVDLNKLSQGCTAAIVFTSLGASYGTAKSGVGISAMGVLRPDVSLSNKLYYNIN